MTNVGGQLHHTVGLGLNIKINIRSGAYYVRDDILGGGVRCGRNVHDCKCPTHTSGRIQLTRGRSHQRHSDLSYWRRIRANECRDRNSIPDLSWHFSYARISLNVNKKGVQKREKKHSRHSINQCIKALDATAAYVAGAKCRFVKRISRQLCVTDLSSLTWIKG